VLGAKGAGTIIWCTSPWSWRNEYPIDMVLRGRAKGRVTFRVVGASGTVWFDHIRIVEGVVADTSLYTRRFSNALVMVRPAQPALGWGDDTAIEYALDGTYRPLQADGTLGDPIEKMASLRLGEAAILIPARK